MDPKSNAEWSADEITMAKWVITSHNPDNNYADETNKKHNAIVNDLQAWFPWRLKSQVTKLYIQLVAEMMQAAQSENQPARAMSNLVSDNSKIQVEGAPMDNMHMLVPNQTDKMPEAMRMVEKVPQRQEIIPHQEGKNKNFWSNDEHMLFLHGLRVHGRGKWKNISRDFVTTRTPAQISSHAQKYFRRQECTSEKQRYSINDVSLCDVDEPWMQNNCVLSSQDVPITIGGGTYDPNCFGSNRQLDNMNNPSLYGSSSQLYTMNNLAQVWSPFLSGAGQESSSQVRTWTQPQMGASSSSALALEGDGSQMAWTNNQQGYFLHDQSMDRENMY